MTVSVFRMELTGLQLYEFLPQAADFKLPPHVALYIKVDYVEVTDVRSWLKIMRILEQMCENAIRIQCGFKYAIHQFAYCTKDLLCALHEVSTNSGYLFAPAEHCEKNVPVCPKRQRGRRHLQPTRPCFTVIRQFLGLSELR